MCMCGDVLQEEEERKKKEEQEKKEAEEYDQWKGMFEVDAGGSVETDLAQVSPFNKQQQQQQHFNCG